MIFNTIEVPIFIPLIGSLFIILFLYLLFKINSKIEKITKLPNTLTNENIKDSNVLRSVSTLNIQSIKAPMVGILYLTPDPEKPPYVKIGDHIKQCETVCVIEAMKTFNEIKSPISGIVKEILHSNGSPIEFGEDIIIIE